MDSDFLKKQKEGGVTKKLVAFEMIDRGIPRKDYQIFDAKSNCIGKVTSGTMSPSLKVGIGLGYVNLPLNKLDTEIYVAVRNKMLKAKVVKLPFYKS